MFVAHVTEQTLKFALVRGEDNLWIGRCFDRFEQMIGRVGKAGERIGIQHQARLADSAARTNSRVRSPTPAPGPITQAFRRLSANRSANSALVSMARIITAVKADALIASASRGEASVTSPAPARSAPRADSRAAPVAASSPETTTAWPRAYLWPSIRGTGNDARQSAGIFSKVWGWISSSTLGVDADIDQAHAAAMEPSRQQQMPRLAAEERNGLGGAHRDAHHGAGGAVDAAGKIDAEHRRAARIDGLDDVVRIALDGTVEAGAEQRVDDQRGRADRLRIARQHRALPAARGECCVALQGVAIAQQDDGDLAAARHQFGRRDKTIAAIVAAPGDDEDRTLLHEVHGSLRHRLAGPQHQREARRAAGYREAVGVLHFSRRENFHAQIPT